MKKLLLGVLALAAFTIATQAQANRFDNNPRNDKVIVVKPIKKHHKRVVVVQPRYQAHNQWMAVAATVGIILALDSAGNTVHNGQPVVFLESPRYAGNSDVQVITQNGVTYIIQ